MKTLITFLCALMLAASGVNAQLNYTFTATSSPYVPITGTIAPLTPSAPAVAYPLHDEGYSNNIPIGFSFNYNGVPYTTIHANTDGFATFTPMTPTDDRTTYYSTPDLSAGPYSTNSTRPVLAPLWDDLDLFSNNGITYTTAGTAPNRIFTLQWDKVYFSISAADIGLAFQIKLYETSNVVEFRYLSYAGAAFNGTASIGITGIPVGTSNFISLGDASAAPTASSTVETFTINTKPATNQVYRFSPANQAPSLSPIPNKTVDELSTLTFTAVGSDPDAGQTLEYSLANQPAGASIDPVTGVFSWTPSEAQGPGTYNIKVRASDNGIPVLYAEQIVNVVVNEVNTAPVLNAIANKTVNELSLLTFTPSATDADLPTQTLTYTLTGLVPSGATINSATGVFSWTPTEVQGPGNYTFNVRVTDNGPSSMFAEQAVNITVNEVNATPTLAAIGTKTVNELSTLTFTAVATDPDIPAQTLAYSITGTVPAGASIDPVTGMFNWTPTEAQGPGSYTFNVRATDNGSPALFTEQPVTVTVNEVNTPPVLANIGNKNVDELSLLTFSASATDADLPAQALLYSLTGTVPSGASIDPVTGVFNWTPTEAQGPGTYTFNVRATDNAASPLFAEQPVTIKVNEVNVAPVLTAIGNKTVNELTPLTFAASATDADIPAQSLSYSLTGTIPTGASIDPGTGVFNWTPTEAQGPGSFTFNVRVTDNASPSLFAEQPVTITVNEVNSAPSLAAIGNKTVNELSALTFTASATDADIPAQTLAYSLSGTVPTGASIDPLTGVFNWTPTEAQGPGSYTFNVKATDNGSPALFTEQPVTITVNEVNTPPVLATIANQTVNELSALTFTVSATDADIPAQPLTYSLTGTVPAGASINPATGVFNWTPTEVQGPGSFSFNVRVTDNGPSALFTEQPVTITVNEVNVSPVLSPIGNQTVNALSTLTFTAVATDSDVPVQTITYSLTGTVPAGASINPVTGAFSWTPTAAQAPGTYNFIIQASDNGTPSLSAQEPITVTVLPAPVANQAPVLQRIGNKTVNELSALTFTASATDPDVPAQTLTYSLVGTIPTGATINGSTGVFNWTPTEAQGPGVYTFKVRVTDNGSPVMFTEEQISVTVNEVNTAPVLAALGNKNVNELSVLSFTASATDADLPAQTLTYSLTGAAPTGASIDPATGMFSWTPTEAQGPGSYTFNIRVTDNGPSSLFAEQPITITVNEVNTAPTLAPIDNKTVNELSALTFTASATDGDLPVQTLAYSLTGTVPAGASINPVTGVFNWTPTEAQGPGSYTFKIRATDNGLSPLFAELPVTITVNEVNTAPVLAAISNQTVNELSTLTFTASATDADLPAQALTYSLTGTVPSGATINPTTGVFNWTPTALQGPASYSFNVRVTDNGPSSLFAEQPVSITVNDVNRAPGLSNIGNKTVNELTTLTFTASATDPDVPAQTLTFSLTGSVPAGASIDPLTGVFNWTPTEAQGPGSYTFNVRVTDNAASPLFAEQPVTITVNEVNTPPVLATLGTKTVSELSTLTFTASATDADLPAQTLVFSLTGAVPTGAMIDPVTGVFNWTPTEAQGPGTYTFNVRVTDKVPSSLAAATSGLFAEQPVTITVTEVNVSPVLTAIGNKTVNATNPLTFTAKATDADLPAQTITYSLTGTVPSGATINPSTGVFTWTPTASQASSNYTFGVRATDNGVPALFDEEIITVVVGMATSNKPPVLAPIGNKTVDELTELRFKVSATDPNVPQQKLRFSLVGAVPSGAKIDKETGEFKWRPTELQGPNTYTFSIRVTDDGTPPMYAEEQITIVVNEVVEITKDVKVKIKKCAISKCATLMGSTHGLTAPFSYKWSTGATTPTILACPTSDATYRLTITGRYETRQTDFNVDLSDKPCKNKKVKGDKGNEKNKKNDIVNIGATYEIEQNGKTTVNVYPNPTIGRQFHLSIKGIGNSFENATMFITDILGRKVRIEKITSKEFDVSLKGQVSGIYLVHVFINNHDFTTKLVVE